MDLRIILKGMAMGLAEAIPGVSGGTIAFITGIYERLLAAIGSILGPEVVGSLRRDGVGEAWRMADGKFLLQLGGGMVLGLGVAIVAITELLEAYPPVVWSFFFGLIVSSAVFIGKQIERWNLGAVTLLIVGALVAFGLTSINPLGGSDSLLLVFLAGSVAISALILPGISGSFILVILGMYTVVFGALRAFVGGDAGAGLVVGAFALGCLAGLALFSRILTYTFRTYPNQTFALLTGFMIGSLNKLWPWRNVLTTRTNSSGEEVPLLEEKVLWSGYDGEAYLLWVIVAFGLGLAAVLLLESSGGERADDLVEELEELKAREPKP